MWSATTRYAMSLQSLSSSPTCRQCSVSATINCMSKTMCSSGFLCSGSCLNCGVLPLTLLCLFPCLALLYYILGFSICMPLLPISCPSCL